MLDEFHLRLIHPFFPEISFCHVQFETFSDFSVLVYTGVLSDLSMNTVNATRKGKVIEY